MSLTLSERGVDVALKESRLAPRRRLRFAAVVNGQSEDGAEFEEKAVVRDLSMQGAHLMLSHRPRLQSELRVAIESAGEQNRSSIMTLRATVIHCKAGRENNQNGVGIVFIAEVDPAAPSD